MKLFFLFPALTRLHEPTFHNVCLKGCANLDGFLSKNNIIGSLYQWDIEMYTLYKKITGVYK